MSSWKDNILENNPCGSGLIYIEDIETEEEFWKNTNNAVYLIWYAVVSGADILPFLRTLVDGPCIQAVIDGRDVTDEMLEESMANNEMDFCVGIIYSNDDISIKRGFAAQIVWNEDTSICDTIRNNVTL